MELNPLPTPPSAPGARVHRDLLRIETQRSMQAVDITDLVADVVLCSGIFEGIVNVQTHHAATAIVAGENGSLLPGDLCDLELPDPVRTGGHLLGASETLNVADGRLRLGPRQRIFLIEFAGPRARTVSLTTLGPAPENAQRSADDANSSASNPYWSVASRSTPA
jgi:thiamine phosphate synthase YjbQ (UPF0047 family)